MEQIKAIGLKFSWGAASLALALMLARPAAAQDQNAAPPAVQSQSQPTPPISRPIPERTVGLQPGKVVRWSLRDAVVLALEKNVDIELERENVRLAQYDVFAAQGFYDPLTTSNISYNSFVQANTRLFSGTTATTTDQHTLTYNFGLQQALERTGASYQVNFNNQRATNNFGSLSPQYSPQLQFSVTQPLFKNYKIDQSRRQIRLSKKRLDLSDAVFRQRVIEIISRVQAAYWDLALAIQNEKIARDSVDLAGTQLRNNQRQVEVGTLAPIDVVSAATLLETRRAQVFQTINAVAQAENALKALTVDSPNSELWDSKIDPVEEFALQPVVLPLVDALKLATENRPEIKQLGLQKEVNQIDLEFFHNQAKPQIDLVGSYTMLGISGSKNAENPLAANTPTCITTNPPTPAGCIPDTFLGGYGASLGNLFKNNYRTWSVGVNFSLPLRNRTAKANLGRTQETGRQIELQARRQLQNIEVEVRNAVQSVETAKMRIEAARAAREYAKQQLEGEGKKFAAGLSTTFFVLQRQTDLSQARFTELQALADYNKSVAELQRVISTTLTSNNIEIKAETPVTIK